MKKLNFLLLFTFTFHLSTYSQTYDICVYGGTSAGVMAAYSAKMAGKSVLLIEPSKHLGGLSTGGLGQTDIGNKYAITGISRDFYRRIGQHYGKFEQWTFEPHVAENLFQEYVKRANFSVLMQHHLLSINSKDAVIQSIEIENGVDNEKKIIKAKVFIDCTYEGDLMAKAGVSYTVGREANAQYGETWNGVQLLNKHQFPDGIDPYKTPGDSTSGLLWGISNHRLAATGSGDKWVQAYNFRLCLSKNPANQVAISRPADYDSTKYELLLRQIAVEKPTQINWGVMHIADMPNQKTDINNKGGFSTDMIGENYDYAEADYATRQKIVKTHESYTKGFLYFVGHDPRMPEHLRRQMLEWGYPKDEYTDNQHFSPQMYVREARRMVGEYVMTQQNCEGRASVQDGVGMAAYTMDSHNCQRLLVRDATTGKMQVKNEGDVQVGGFPPYPISYRSLIPKRGECKNLLVPVCLSATHIAYGSIRMEPVFMVLAQSAAMAAVLAIDSQQSVQDIDVQKLQNVLKTNPLADKSEPEILLDNDVTPANVSSKGNWQTSSKGGKYAATQLNDNSKGAELKTVTFTPDIQKAGRYDVYLFNASPGGGGGNPGHEEGNQTGKSRQTQLRLKAGAMVKSMRIDTQQQINDWLKVGTFQLAKGKTNFLEISNKNADGIVVADAVLFVPK